MQRTSRVRAGAELLSAFFLIGFTGLLPAGVLYWLMRPTIVVNPGLSAYQAPRPDPLFPRIANRAANSHALPFVAAKQQAEWQLDGRSAFAAAPKNPPEATRADVGKKKPQVRAQAHARRSSSAPATSVLTAPMAFRTGIDE
jgi:hypothetical protein